MSFKEVTVRKEHECAGCGDPILKGAKAEYHRGRFPVHEGDKQIGISYDKWYFHTYRCDLEPERRELCGKGEHDWEIEYEFDHYVDCHRVYAPTDKDVCKHCGETREAIDDNY